MQGTIVMLMAMSGLGCHHKHRDVAPVSACYSSCYSSCYDVGMLQQLRPGRHDVRRAVMLQRMLFLGL